MILSAPPPVANRRKSVGEPICHYSDVITCAMASQITSLSIVHAIVYSGRSKKKLKLRVIGLCAEIQRWPVNSPHKWPVKRKMFPFDDVIMWSNNQCKYKPHTKGLYSLNDKTSYPHLISLRIEARRLDVNDGIALKFDRHLGSAAAEVPVKLSRDWKSLNPNLAASRDLAVRRPSA